MRRRSERFRGTLPSPNFSRSLLAPGLFHLVEGWYNLRWSYERKKPESDLFIKPRRFTMISKCQLKISLQLFFTLLSFLFLPFAAFSQTPFYQGKTITIVWGSTAGGTGDLRLRAVVPVLQKHIPGN